MTIRIAHTLGTTGVSQWVHPVGSYVFKDGAGSLFKPTDKIYCNGTGYELNKPAVECISHISYLPYEGAVSDERIWALFKYNESHFDLYKFCKHENYSMSAIQGANGLFFIACNRYDDATGEYDSFLACSADGYSWTECNMPAHTHPLSYSKICFDGTWYFYIPYDQLGIAYKSTDGINWTALSIPVFSQQANHNLHVATAANMWMYFNFYQEYYYSTDNGETWTYGDAGSTFVVCPKDSVVVDGVFYLLVSWYSVDTLFYGDPVSGFTAVSGTKRSYYNSNISMAYFNGNIYLCMTDSYVSTIQTGRYMLVPPDNPENHSDIDLEAILGVATSPCSGYIVASAEHLHFMYKEYNGGAEPTHFRVVTIDLQNNFTSKLYPVDYAYRLYYSNTSKDGIVTT